MDVGEIYTSKYGELKIIEYVNSGEVVVEFTQSGFRYAASAGSIRKGLVKDYSLPTIYGVGKNTLGKRVVRSNRVERAAKAKWLEMLRRCYSDDFTRDNLTYSDCKVCDDWKDYKNFYLWFAEKYTENTSGFALDKDLWLDGNKIYGADCCFLVPQELNNIALYATIHKPMTCIELSRDGKRYTPYCSDQYGKRVRLGTTPSFTDAVNTYRSYKSSRVIALAKKYKGVLEDRLYEKLVNFQYETYTEEEA